MKRIKFGSIIFILFFAVSNLALSQSQAIERSDFEKSIEIDSSWVSNYFQTKWYKELQKSIDDNSVEASINKEKIDWVEVKERFKKLNQVTPMEVKFTKEVKKFISFYLNSRKETLSIISGFSPYYFPLFEEILNTYNLPLELKYLPIIESGLRAHAVSKAHAVGLWQLMYQTAKMYDLEINSYIDERRDPIKATQAACKYLSQLYYVFEDWGMVLASYNSGPGRLNKAIRRSGGKRTFNEIKMHLPTETKNYVPRFTAILYIMEYAEEHGIYPKNSKITKFETDTIHLKQAVSVTRMANILDLSPADIKFFNPKYKRDVIPFIQKKPMDLILPTQSIGEFVSNENKIYEYLEKEEPELTNKDYRAKINRVNNFRYKVKGGDTLLKLSKSLGVQLADLKLWNNIKDDNGVKIGQTLFVSREAIDNLKTSINFENLSVYTVKKGDTLWEIVKKMPGNSISEIKKWNGIGNLYRLKPGMKLKIFKI